MRNMRNVLAGLMLAVFVIAGVSSEATAAEMPAAATASFEATAATPSADEADAPSESPHITINRWRGATASFSSNIGFSEASALLNAANRSMTQSSYMSIGNFFWGAASSSVTIANDLDIFNNITRTVDVVAESLMSAFLGPFTGKATAGGSLLAIIVAIAVVSTVFQVVKRNHGAGLFKRLMAIGMIVGYLVFVSAAITGPNAPSKQTDTSYSPPTGTPSWMVSKTNEAVSKVGGLLSSVTLGITNNPLELESGATGEKPNSCVFAATALEKAAVKDAGTNRGAEMRIMVDRMWQMTGLRTWIPAQFGTGNKIGNDVFCYALDLGSSEVTPADTLDMYSLTLKSQGVSMFPGWETKNLNKLAMLHPATNQERYGAITAMAACNWDGQQFTGRSGFVSQGASTQDNLGFNPNKGQDSDAASDTAMITGAGYEHGLSTENINEACAAAFGAPSGSNWWKGDFNDTDPVVAGVKADYLPAFIMPGNEQAISYKVQGPKTTNFVSAFYGTETTYATPLVFTYAATVGFSTIPIMFFALATILMKVILVISIIALWVSVISSVFAENPWHDRLKTPVVQMITTAFLATGMAIVLGMLLVFSMAISAAGMAMTATGGGMGTGALLTQILISSLAPCIALIALNWLWKKCFPGAPSPMSVKGMQAWAKGAPLAATAVAAGVGAGIGSRMGGMAKNSARRAGSALVDKVTPGSGAKSGRKSGMGGGTQPREFDTTGAKTVTDTVVEDQKAAKAQIKGEDRAARRDRNGRLLSSMWTGTKKVGTKAAGVAWAGYANMALATTPEGREKLWIDLKQNTAAAAQRLDRAMPKLSYKKVLPAAKERALNMVGLPAEERARIRAARASGEPVRRFPMLSQATAHVGQKTGSGVKAVAGGTHRAVMRAAGPDATAGQAYRKAGLQAAAVAGTIVAGGAVVAPAVAGVVGVQAARGNWKSKRADRQARIDTVVHERQAERAEAAESVKAQKQAERAVAAEEERERAKAEKAQLKADAKAAREAEEAARQQLGGHSGGGKPGNQKVAVEGTTDEQANNR